MVCIVQVKELADIPFPLIQKFFIYSYYWFLSGQIPDNRIFNSENRISFGCSLDNIRITGSSNPENRMHFECSLPRNWPNGSRKPASRIRVIGFVETQPDFRLKASGKPFMGFTFLPNNRPAGYANWQAEFSLVTL